MEGGSYRREHYEGRSCQRDHYVGWWVQSTQGDKPSRVACLFLIRAKWLIIYCQFLYICFAFSCIFLWFYVSFSVIGQFWKEMEERS